MTEKRPRILTYVAIIAAIALVAILALIIFTPKPVVGPGTGPQLTERDALIAMESELFMECLPGGVPESYRSCAVDISKETDGSNWLVRVTYDGLYDDSVQATRVTAYLVNQNGEWVVSEASQTQKCHVGRGHQDFSIELCV